MGHSLQWANSAALAQGRAGVRTHTCVPMSSQYCTRIRTRRNTSLGVLPPSPSPRGLIIPVMDRILSPYLKGGGAKAFNFQMLSQDLLAATLGE